jgi:hypothetical protein
VSSRPIGFIVVTQPPTIVPLAIAASSRPTRFSGAPRSPRSYPPSRRTQKNTDRGERAWRARRVVST